MQKTISSNITNSKSILKHPPIWGAWGAFFSFVLFFFALAYPHHLHYQEQFQLFLFDSNYVWDVIKLPGGAADLLGRFCTQFFLYAWVGAAIIAILLSSVQLLTLRLTKWGSLYGLSYVPTFLLWMFLLDENALLGGVWAVLLTLLASWFFDSITNTKLRFGIIIATTPLLYWIIGPVCVILFLLHAPRSKQSAWYYSVFAVFVVMLIIIAHYVPVPSKSLWLGIHYHRYPTTIPTLLWASALSIIPLTFLTRKCISLPTLREGWGESISFALVALCMGGFVWKNANFKAEKTMKYDFMACHQQWNRILETINTEHPNNQIGVTVQNLALAMRGQLLSNMFQYNQNGLLGLLPDVQRDATSPMPTAEAMYQLGMINIAQRTVFEAQESILDFQKSARCYKRLAQTNLINGDYEVARKYLLALKKTLFYSKWADETLSLLGNEKAIGNHTEYGNLRKFAYNRTFYFSDAVTPEMLEDLYKSNKNNSLAYQYMMAAFMLTGDKESFIKYAPKNQ